MLKRSRFYFSAMCAALIVVSLLMTTGARACEEPPQTMLSLYMNSDLVVLARYESDGESKKSFENEYGYTLDTERNLSVTRVFKGAPELKTVSYIYSDYVANPNQTQAEIGDEEYVHDYEDYFDLSKTKTGGEYLFFLTKDKESGQYRVTDYYSGVREFAGKSAFYEKSLGELAAIAAAESREKQYEMLTEWIVANIENAETREEGIRDLSESFYGMQYQDEDPNFKGKGPFVVNDGYGIYTVGVAKYLTPAQKERLSAALYPMLQTAWFAEKPAYADYGIAGILGGINKTRLAVHTYNALQSVDKDDIERRSLIMGFLTDVLSDDTLSKTYYEYLDLKYKIEEKAKETTPEAKQQIKVLTASRETLARDFDKRFKFLYGRNFVAVETKKS